MKKSSHSYPRITVIHSSQIVKGILAILVLLLCIFSLSGLLTSLKWELRLASQPVNSAAGALSGKTLFGLMAMDNQLLRSSVLESEQMEPISKQFLKLSANLSLDDPRSLLGRELPGFSIFDSEILVAGEGTDYTNMPSESSAPAPLNEADLQKTNEVPNAEGEVKRTGVADTGGKKVVFIYHTHNREAFLPYLKGVTDPDMASHSQLNITKVGDKLQRSLEAQGIGTTVDKSDIQGQLVNKGLSYSKSYKESREVVSEALAANRDVSYLIDVHRDALRKKNTTVTIDGKVYAKLAFIVGGENAKYKKNFAVVERIHKELEKKYPGLSRGVFKKAGAGTNGVFNQDLSEQAMLIEAGGVDNTYDELYRSMDAFAEAFANYYWDESNSLQVNGDVPSNPK